MTWRGPVGDSSGELDCLQRCVRRIDIPRTGRSKGTEDNGNQYRCPS